MSDTYLMNKETGEIEPSESVIRSFYATHAWNESWTDYWQETGMPVQGSTISAPDFAGALAV